MTAAGSPAEPAVPAWLAQLRSTLTAADARISTAGDRRPAAVLILFGQDADGPDLLFIERASSLRSHPGQVAFPGGRADPGDGDLVGTALRESAEETGLDPAGVRVFGLLESVEVPVSGFRVTPVLGWWQQAGPVGVVDPGEVASVRRIPIGTLTDPANRYRMLHPSGRAGPGFLIGDLLIWGVTAHILNGVLTRGGWQRPWNRNRTMEVPLRYLGRQPVAGDVDAELEGEVE